MNEDLQMEPFNPRDHLIQLKSKQGEQDYLPVQWRLRWFRECCPQGTIDTQEVEVDLDREVEEEAFVWNNETRRSEKTVKRARGYARFKATVTDGKGGKAEGTKSENAASFPDFAEKAETGAIGRALAALGYGTQFAPELTEAHRIVDSPVDRDQAHSARIASPSQVSPQQIEKIKSLLTQLKREPSPNLEKLTSQEAGKMIYELDKDLKAMQRGGRS